MIYALLRRKFGLPSWGASLATVPLLYDGYQIQLEHLILSDTTFTFLVMCAVTLLLWKDRPTWKVALAIGLIVGFSWLTRSVGAPVLLGVLLYMLIRRAGWKMMAVTAAACALPVLSYMTWYKVDSGKFAITESNGIFLYARVYKFADCHKMHGLPVSEYPLCTEPANRLPNSQDGIWNAASPFNRFPGQRFSPENNRLGNDFAKRAILSQPSDYVQVVAHDFFRVFRWNRTVFPDKATYSQYEFGTKGNALPDWRMDSDSTASGEASSYEHGDARTRVIEPFAGFMRGYQDAVYLRGTMLGGVLLLGLGGMIALWRRFGGEALLPWTLATGLLLAPAATAEFDYRYVLPAVPLAALAAGMAFTPEVRHRLDGWWRRLRGRPGPAGSLEVPSAPVGQKVPEVTAGCEVACRLAACRCGPLPGVDVAQVVDQRHVADAAGLRHLAGFARRGPRLDVAALAPRAQAVRPRRGARLPVPRVDDGLVAVPVAVMPDLEDLVPDRLAAQALVDPCFTARPCVLHGPHPLGDAISRYRRHLVPSPGSRRASSRGVPTCVAAPPVP
jgi:hypothetical protein